MNREKVILLVEDDEDDEVLTLRAFEEGKVENRIDVVRDGQEALDYLFGCEGNPVSHTAPLPEMVLLDLKLPKVDGLEVLRRIRENERTRLLPVVVLTSSSEEQDMVRSYQLGANSYVNKPVEFERFVSAAHQLGLYWLVLNKTPAMGA